jgi:hypothetical protein
MTGKQLMKPSLPSAMQQETSISMISPQELLSASSLLVEPEALEQTIKLVLI